MIPRLENAQLTTDLDFDGFVFNNPGEFLPVPDGLLDIDDPRLSDARQIIDGTVTNDSVNAAAAIEQSKLDLDGNIPAGWLGSGADQAAQGDLVELVANKNQINGYPGLDANGRVSSGDLPSTGPASGTVTKVGLALPSEFLQPSDVISGAGTLDADWEDQPDNSWFGTNGDSLRPTFLTSQIPMELMADIDATIFTTGVFPVERLPVAVGLGVGHARGLVPDPGDGDSVGNYDDYLGRDMKWKTLQFIVAYQPTLLSVQLTILGYQADGALVNVSCPSKGASVFYRVTNPAALPPVLPSFDIAETNPFNIVIEPGDFIEAYAAKTGWNNSPMTKLTPPPQPETT